MAQNIFVSFHKLISRNKIQVYWRLVKGGKSYAWSEEPFSSLSAVKRSLLKIKRSISKSKILEKNNSKVYSFVISKSKHGKFYWTFFSKNGHKMMIGYRFFKRISDAKKDIEKIKSYLTKEKNLIFKKEV